MRKVNQRPITFPITSHHHLDEGCAKGCQKRTYWQADNLIIDKMVTMDSYRGKRNLCMAWVNVKKARNLVSPLTLTDLVELNDI